MQSSQVPRPINHITPGPRTIPPGRSMGSKPMPKAGLPKPISQGLVGGKPVMPINSLVQPSPNVDPEEASGMGGPVHNTVVLPEQSEQDVKLNGKAREDVKELRNKEDELEIRETEEKNKEKETIRISQEENQGRIREKESENVRIQPSIISRDIETEVRPDTVTVKENSAKLRENTHERDPETYGANKSDEIDTENRAEGWKTEEIDDRPPKFEKSSNQEGEAGVGEVAFQLPPRPSDNKNLNRKANANSKAKPGPFGNPSNKSSPGLKTSDANEQGHSQGQSKPSRPVMFIPKAQVSTEEESQKVEDTDWNTNTDFETKKEDISLLLKVKALELELEKERKEKAVIQAEQERLLDENSLIREELNEANRKLTHLEKPEQNVCSKDLLRKEDEIKRLKAELKSTMEGSRLITEHSNRVISESTKFKEEAETLIASLVREKDELYQSFIDYKRKIHEEYVSKVYALQEKEKHLEEKVKESENYMERYQNELREKSHTISKLSCINDQMQTILTEIPMFHHVASEYQNLIRLLQAKVKDKIHVETAKSPNEVREISTESETNKKDFKEVEGLSEPRTHDQQDSPFTQNIHKDDLHRYEQAFDHHAPKEPENERRVEENTYQNENKAILEPFQNSEAIELADNGWGEEAPLIDVEIKHEDQEIHRPEEHRQEEIEVLGDGWGAEEIPLVDIETKHEDYGVQRTEEEQIPEGIEVAGAGDGWGIEEAPLVDIETKHETEIPKVEEQIEAPIEVEGNGWGIEEPPLVDEEIRQENQEIALDNYQQREEPAELEGNGWGEDAALIDIETKHEDQGIQRTEDQQRPDETEVPGDGWGAEEIPLVDIETQHGDYGVQRTEEEQIPEGIEIAGAGDGWGIEETPLVDIETKHETEVPKVEEQEALVQLVDNGFGIEEPPIVNVEIKHENLEIHQGESVTVPQEAESHENYKIMGEKVSSEALTAVPVHRLPQRKNKAQPPKKQTFGFKPALANWQPPANPESLVDEREENVVKDFQNTPPHDSVTHESEIVPISQPNFHEVEAPTEVTPIITQEVEPPFRHEITGEKVSSDALTAAPNYRMPQKKKKGKNPPKKQTVGFIPPTTLNVPEETNTEIESQTSNQFLDVATQETHSDQYGTNGAQTNYNQDPEGNIISADDHTFQHEDRPPQIHKGPFTGDGRTDFGKPREIVSAMTKPPQNLAGKRIVSKSTAFGQAKILANGPFMSQNNIAAHDSNSAFDGANTTERPPIQKGGFIPRKQEQAVDLVSEYTQNSLQHPNPEEYDGEKQSNHEKSDLNGHAQTSTQGKLVISKAIKKKEPASGSIFS